LLKLSDDEEEEDEDGGGGDCDLEGGDERVGRGGGEG